MSRESVLARLREVKRLIEDGKPLNAKWNIDELIKEIEAGEESEKAG